MQTTKYLLAMGALAAVLVPAPVQGAPDTPEQAKMREVLRRMMEEPGAAKPAPPPAATRPEPPPTAAPAPKPAPVRPAPAKPVFGEVPPPSQPLATTPAPVAPPPAVIAPAPTAVVPVAPAAVAAQTYDPVPPADDAESIARAREVMRQKMQQLESAPTATATASATQPIAPAPAAKTARVETPPVKELATSYAPIEAPASPLSSAKQAKLADLLARYKTDAINAQEYHSQRAAILAEP